MTEGLNYKACSVDTHIDCCHDKVEQSLQVFELSFPTLSDQSEQSIQGVLP